jgi:putative chitinase
MPVISREQLLVVMPNARGQADIYLDHLNAAMDEFEINTPARIAALLAQVAHESGELRHVRELASGAAYDTGRLAARLGNTPEANGDGQRYKGRGLIQITGRINYKLCGEALDVDLLEHPELIEQPSLACRSAAWFWVKGAGMNLSPAARQRCGSDCNLNEIADRGDFLAITYAINGGTNGLEDREKFHARAQAALRATA